MKQGNLFALRRRPFQALRRRANALIWMETHAAISPAEEVERVYHMRRVAIEAELIARNWYRSQR